MSTDPDYYEVLEVPFNAEPREIVNTYRRLARQFHPDIISDPAATQYMRTLNRALEVLGNPEKRREYDRERLQALAREALAGRSGASGSATRPRPPPRPNTGVPQSRALIRQERAVGRPILTPAADRPIETAARPASRRMPILAVLIVTAFVLGLLSGIAILTLLISDDSLEPAVQSEGTTDTQASPASPTSRAPAATAASESPGSLTGSGGTWLVGEEISPGIWRAVRPESCSWRRMASPDVSDNAIIGAGTWLTVEILPSDVAFWSDGCGGWSQTLEPPSATPEHPFGPGTWLVGEEVAPGLWQNSDSTQGCSWARLGNLDGSPSAMTATGSTNSTTIVVALGARDVAFDSRGCGTWTLVSG